MVKHRVTAPIPPHSAKPSRPRGRPRKHRKTTKNVTSRATTLRTILEANKEKDSQKDTSSSNNTPSDQADKQADTSDEDITDFEDEESSSDEDDESSSGEVDESTPIINKKRKLGGRMAGSSSVIELKKPSIPSEQIRGDMNSTSNQLPMSSPSAIELKKPSIPTKQSEEDVHDISHSSSSSNKKEEFTTQLKTLEAFQNLVLSLNFPLLADFQKRIEEKIKNVEQSEESKIAGSDIQMAMEVCVRRVIRNSALSSNSEFASLREFLLVMKSVLFASKFDCLDSFQQKLSKTMEELRDQDKRIPVEKVQSALQTALDIMDL